MAVGRPISGSPPSAVAQISAQQSRSLTPWFAGLSNRLSASCNVICIEDSITEGEHANGPPSTGFENRWTARLRDMLRARYPTAGLTGGGRGFIGAAPTGETSFTWPTTLAGSPYTATTGGLKAKFVQLGASGQSVTFSLTGDSADIMWMQVAFGGTFSWAVDGGSATKISTNGASTADGKITHIPLGSSGPHTLVLSWVSGSPTSPASPSTTAIMVRESAFSTRPLRVADLKLGQCPERRRRLRPGRGRRRRPLAVSDHHHAGSERPVQRRPTRPSS